MDQLAQADSCHSEIASEQNQSLGRGDWIKAALEALIEKGIDAVKITQLSEQLGVTRGSFYWHFKGREDILRALIDFWREKNTAAVISAAAQGPDIEDAVLALMGAWVDNDVFDPRLDLAVRSWSQADPTLKAIVQSNDELRLNALTDMYRRAGRASAEAIVAARNIYFMQMGYFACDIEEPLDVRLSYLQAYVESYTGKPLSNAKAQDFITRVTEKLSADRK